MGDNSVYWTQDQSNWYQHQQPGPPPQPPPTQSPQYQNGPYPASALPNDLCQATPPPPQPQQAPPTQPQTHQQHHPLQYHHPQSQQQHHHHHHPHPPPNAPLQQQQLHHQQAPLIMNHNEHPHNNQALQNGISNGNHSMQSSIPGPPRTPLTHPPATMNHYNPHMNNIHHETLNAPMQPAIDPSSNYQVHSQPPQPQIQPQPQPPPIHKQQQQQSYQPQQPPPMMYAQPNSYQNMAPAQNTPNSLHPSMQQAPPHQSHYSQQYSPPSYWNSTPMHNQSNYGPPPSVPAQSVTTPPAGIPDNAPNYHTTSAQPPPMPMPKQQPAHPPPPPNLPYDSRSTSMSANYNAPYQQSAPGYYSPHDVQPHPTDPSLSYDLSHQQPPNPQSNWSNGYYQPSQSPYPPSVMNSYQMPYNGTNNVPNQTQVPAQAQGPPQLNPSLHYPTHHQQPQQQLPTQQQSQQWSPQNQAKPIIERTNKVGEKKPVKPRAPKKQSNPNAPSGRRKRPSMTEENKQSGYAKFFTIKRREMPSKLEFTQASKAISAEWNSLTEEERSLYAEDVSKKRKEMLKRKASQQAQNLLVQGINDDGMMPGVKKEKT